MAEGPGTDFKCCTMCSRHCFETHGDFGASEAQKLFSVPTFFRLIKRSHIEGSQYLRIPVLFYEDWNNKIGRTLDLKGPWGFKCQVTAERHSHGYVLRTGFKSFLDHHLIEAGDAIVFYLIAESVFLVKVYDKFGSARKASSTKNAPTDAEQEEEPTEDSDGERSDEKAVDRRLKLGQKKLKKKVEVRSRKEAKDHLRSKHLERFFSFDQPAAGLAEQENCVYVSPVSKNLATGDTKQPVSLNKVHLAQKRKLSDASCMEENENELDEANESGGGEAKRRQVKDAKDLIRKLDNTSQLVILTISHMKQYRVYLSKLQLLLPKDETYLTLVDEHDEHYSVKWSVSEKNSRSRLSTGWNQIAADHKLVVGDVCVFEVDGPFVIKVHIFPLANYCNPTVENLQQEKDHRDDLQPSALEQSMSEEAECLGSQEDTVSAGFCPTK